MSEQNKTNTAPAAERHETHLDRILRVGRLVGVYLLPVALVIGFVVWLLVGGMAVYHLGWFHFALSEPTPTLTSVAVTVTALMLAAYLAATGRLQKNVARSVALAAFIGWLAILALLALLDMGLTSGALRFSQEATGDAWRINIPPELLEISKFIYALVAALPLIVFLILWATHSSEEAGKYNTLSHGAKASGLFFLKLSLAVAMFSFEAFFGLYAGYSPVMAIPAALLNAVVFTVALNEVQAAVNDGRSAKLWGSIAIFYSALMFAIAYEVGIQFGGDAFKYAPQPEWLRVFAETGFLSSIGLSAIVLALAKLSPLWSNRKRGDEPLHVRAADYVVGVKESARKALGKTDEPAKANPALPAGTPLTLADDGSKDSNWLGKFVFVFNGESDYDEGGAIKSRADELLGEIGMRVKHGFPIELEFWLFDKESFTSALKLVTGHPMQVSIGALTAQCNVTGFTRAADGSVTHAEVTADVFWDVAKANMTDAEARRLLDGAIHKQDDELNPKTSENGVKYGTTGSVVDAPAKGWPTPEELAAHRKWVEDNAKKSPRQ